MCSVDLYIQEETFMFLLICWFANELLLIVLERGFLLWQNKINQRLWHNWWWPTECSRSWSPNGRQHPLRCWWFVCEGSSRIQKRASFYVQRLVPSENSCWFMYSGTEFVLIFFICSMFHVSLRLRCSAFKPAVRKQKQIVILVFKGFVRMLASEGLPGRARVHGPRHFIAYAGLLLKSWMGGPIRFGMSRLHSPTAIEGWPTLDDLLWKPWIDIIPVYNGV